MSISKKEFPRSSKPEACAAASAEKRRHAPAGRIWTSQILLAVLSLFTALIGSDKYHFNMRVFRQTRLRCAARLFNK